MRLQHSTHSLMLLEDMSDLNLPQRDLLTVVTGSLTPLELATQLVNVKRQPYAFGGMVYLILP